MVETLDQDYPDMESAASAALDTALGIIEERAKFAVVGQVVKTKDDGVLAPSHPSAVKVALGFYESDTKANEAAGQLAFNTAGDMLNTWVVPAFFGTPALWHKEQRDRYAAIEAKADEKRREKMRLSIEKHQAKAVERQAEILAMEEAAGGQQWPCPVTRIKAGACKHDPSCR